MKTATTVLCFALVGYAAAECPNACSGHGTCGAKDSCSCYQSYQGNDCSERTCYFGLAHVDTPKGDLNADGLISGPLTTVVTGSEVYPWGTTEQFPNANSNEGHFYMECSNKGLCDRKTGECDCFDGYEGTACTRAACPNDCSGHGTCESIKELAEMRSYDTNAHDVPATRPAGSANHHDYNAAIEESYSYDLWDADKTMGCKCDPVYYGADCSLKKCKYGVDPMFYDNTDGVIYQTSVVHLGSVPSVVSSAISARSTVAGDFKIIFYDVFGEKYVTKAISAAVTDPTVIRNALQNLPNGVIQTFSHDVTGLAPASVEVALHSASGAITKAGCTGSGALATAASPTTARGGGLGTQGGTGPEFTVRFTTNPGVLKSIEVDTRNLNVPTGSPDFWVANQRQGQFSSRYNNNLGRINTLRYGSTKLFTNTDLSTDAPENTLVKVGGQEFRLNAASTAYILTLDQPFLGTSILPVLTNTGVLTASFSTPDFVISGLDNGYKVTHLGVNKPLYVNGCPFVAASPAGGAISSGDTALGVNTATQDCEDDVLNGAYTIFRRSDSDDNQNVYKTANDVGSNPLPTANKVMFTRGSPDAYIVEDLPVAAAGGGYISSYVASTRKLSAGSAAPTTDIVGNAAAASSNVMFVNGQGPLTVKAITTVTAKSVYEMHDSVIKYFDVDVVDSATLIKWPAMMGKLTNTGTTTIATGSILLVDGRRYKVKSRGSSGNTLTGLSHLKLTENYAGGQLTEICAACATSAKATATVTTTSEHTFALGDRLLAQGYLNEDNAVTFVSSADKKAHVCSDGARASTGATFIAGTTDISSAVSLFKLSSGARGQDVSLVVENSASAANLYTYVSQCSNRGTCDASTGVCTCFKGYTRDSCFEQNMLAL
jgi:hypothetical protein